MRLLIVLLAGLLSVACAKEPTPEEKAKQERELAAQKAKEEKEARAAAKVADKDNIKCPKGTKLVKERSKTPGRGCRDRAGTKHGTWFEFMEDGYWTGKYEYGKREGSWQRYTLDGDLEESKVYNAGRLAGGWK